MEINKTWYLGLDMGTNSVGWAVTDENYNLLRAKGKDCGGLENLMRQKTAATRRSFRTSEEATKRKK